MRTSRFAIASFIVAASAVALWCLTEVSGLPLALASLLLAFLAFRDINRRPAELGGTSLAAGSLLLVLVSFLFFQVYVRFVEEHMTSHASYMNMKYLAFALLAYQDVHGTLPPHAVYSDDGEPLLSWRVLILPHIEQEELFKQFRLDEAWDGPHNSLLIPKMPVAFARWERLSRSDPYVTVYQVFVGPGAAFEGPQGISLKDDFPDGASNTILIAEADEPVPWTKPQDLSYAPDKPLPRLGGRFYVAPADATIRRLKPGISDTTFRAAITRNTGDKLGADWNEP